MQTLCWEPHCREADKGSCVSLPESKCVRCVRTWGRFGHAWQSPCFCSRPLTLPRPCDKCPFPFWDGLTRDTVLKRGLDVESFCLPVYILKIVLIICSVKTLFASANCFFSLLKLSWQTSVLPFCLSLWKREKEESKQNQDSCWLAWQQWSPSSWN